MDSPQPIGDTYMPVQQIELEEVAMVEVCDEASEATLRVAQGGYSRGYLTCCPSVCS